MRKFIFLLLMTFFGMMNFSSGQTSPNEKIKKNSELPLDLDLLEFTQNKKLKVKVISVFEPHSGNKETYRGYSLTEILNFYFKKKQGINWEDSHELQFTCIDGYLPSINLSLLKEFRDSAYLVYEFKNKKNFVIDNLGQNEKSVPLGPFYLVWNNIKYPQFKEAGSASWPYQITKMKLIEFNEVYPNLTPPPSAEKKIHQGFELFKKNCLQCHKLGGEGGEKGPELMGVTERYSESWLKTFIDNPRVIQSGSNMSQFNPHIKGKKRTEQIELIIDFLKFKNKK
jgi:cytochrome c2